MDSSIVSDSHQSTGFGKFALELELSARNEVKKAAVVQKKKPPASEAKPQHVTPEVYGDHESESDASKDHFRFNHECNVCKKKFPYKSTMEQHYTVHQKDNRPFQCFILGCNKSYKLRNMLNRHVRSHSNVKDHKCFKCGKTFSWKHVLKRHLITHKDPSILFTCDMCEKSFINAEDLHQHQYSKHFNICM